MDQSSNREGEGHDEGHHQHQFSYYQQQHQHLESVGRAAYNFTASSSSRDPLSQFHSHPHTRDWFLASQTSAEDNTCFRSSYNFMEENEVDEEEARRRIEHQQQTSSSSYYNSHASPHPQTLAATEQIEKEHMFDKVVTPSDVGKLNRLVIPKQHAERYFPLDSSANEKGLLLNFEDRARKLWRFRYSYWNSSQSYVMTKGWSRFVKEKKLDAGDIVSFQRGVGEAFRDRLFIDWRRRPSNPLLFHHDPSLIIPSFSLPHQYIQYNQGNRSAPWAASASTPLYLRPLAQLTSGHHFPQLNYNNNFHSQLHSHPHHYNQYQQQLQQGVRGNFQRSPLYNENNGVISHPYGSAAAVGSSSQTTVYLKSSADESLQSGDRINSKVFDLVPELNTPKAESKKLRLFGVNMECEYLPSTLDESRTLSSSPTLAASTSPPNSTYFQNDDDTSDPNERSRGIMSLNLSF